MAEKKKEDKKKDDPKPEAEQPKEEKADGKVVTCSRCGFEYPGNKAVIVEQQKCCPDCNAPQIWKK